MSSVRVHNKLIRDRIPEYLASRGITCDVRRLDRQDLVEHLSLKLEEEVAEYRESQNIAELADVLEVIRGILDARDLTFEDLEQIRARKHEERGGFREGLFLVKTSE